MITRRSSQRGYMLFVVMGVSLIVGLAMMWTLTQTKRQSDLGRRETDRLQFQTTMARMKHVLDAAQLCTCNLKGLLIANAAGPVIGWRVDLTPDNGQRELFGFYRLEAANTANMGCAAGGLPGNVTLDTTRDVVFHLDSDGNYPSSLRGTRFSLNAFSFVADTSDPLVKRYRARATLASVDDRGQGRSNIADPIDTDVFIEVANSRIRQCYQLVVPPPLASDPKCTKVNISSLGYQPTAVEFPFEVGDIEIDQQLSYCNKGGGVCEMGKTVRANGKRVEVIGGCRAIFKVKPKAQSTGVSFAGRSPQCAHNYSFEKHWKPVPAKSNQDPGVCKDNAVPKKRARR